MRLSPSGPDLEGEGSLSGVDGGLDVFALVGVVFVGDEFGRRVAGVAVLGVVVDCIDCLDGRQGVEGLEGARLDTFSWAVHCDADGGA